MPQFAPGATKTALAPITVSPPGLNCEAELFLGPNDSTKVATSGRVPFVSTGVAKNMSMPIVMPSASGSYHGYIDVFAEGARFLAYELTEDITVSVPATGTLSGRVFDAQTGQPVSGATVAILDLGATTDNQGYYSIPNIVIVPYARQIAVVCNGYESLFQNITINSGSQSLDLNITPLVQEPTTLVLSGTNIGNVYWFGYIIDLGTGEKQTWGAQNIQQPVTLNPPSGTQILIGYQVLTTSLVIIKEAGPYLVELPATSGIFEWNGGTMRFDGGPAGIDLTSTNNKQTIRGNIISNDWYFSRVTVQVTESIPASGYFNAGQYFIGQQIVFSYSIPFMQNNVPALISGPIEVLEAKIEKQSLEGVFYPGWRCTTMRRPRTMPDSAYVFSKNITSESVTGGSYGGITEHMTKKIKINSLTGSVQPFKVVLALTGAIQITLNAVALISIPRLELIGPISNYVYTVENYNFGGFYNPSGYSYPSFTIWAHPDNNAVFSDVPEIDNWQQVGSFGTIWFTRD